VALTFDAESGWQTVTALVAAVRDVGATNGLPFVAAQSDLGDPEPMADAEGRPYAETSFRWIDEANTYWRNRRLALDAQFLNAARVTAEPFFYVGGPPRCSTASIVAPSPSGRGSPRRSSRRRICRAGGSARSSGWRASRSTSELSSPPRRSAGRRWR
jgi:hypothetical protein